jgi:hypothetical protein
MQSKRYGRLKHLHVIGVASAVLACGGAVAQEDPKNIVATQVRAQGYACDDPKSATRDSELSKPNQTVWVLVCENATYRATLVPSMAAQVELLSEKEQASPAPQ